MDKIEEKIIKILDSFWYDGRLNATINKNELGLVLRTHLKEESKVEEVKQIKLEDMVLEMKSSGGWIQKSPNWEAMANNIEKLFEVVNKILSDKK